MLKVWVGLEARKFLQASAESVGFFHLSISIFPDPNHPNSQRSLFEQEKPILVGFIALPSEWGIVKTNRGQYVYRWNDASNTTSFRLTCKTPFFENLQPVPLPLYYHSIKKDRLCEPDVVSYYKRLYHTKHCKIGVVFFPYLRDDEGCGNFLVDCLFHTVYNERIHHLLGLVMFTTHSS